MTFTDFSRIDLENVKQGKKMHKKGSKQLFNSDATKKASKRVSAFVPQLRQEERQHVKAKVMGAFG